MDLRSLILVFIGGGAGSVLRWMLARLFHLSAFPIATLCANILSVIILSFVLRNPSTSEGIKIMLITGFCGGLSTLSTFSLESVQLLKTGHPALFVVNVMLNLVSCTAIVFLLLRSSD